MADLEGIIADAASDATSGITESAPSTESVSSDPGSSASPTSGSTPGAVSPTSAAAPTDDLTSELEALGLKAPEVGQRENRLPYSRVKKIVENAQKKLAEQHQAALKTHQEQLKASQERLQNMDVVERLIDADPDRYLRMLAAIKPQYQRYLSQQQIPQAPQQPRPPQQKQAEPPPQPDASFPDGTRGYSPQGLAALLDWQARRVEQSVTARVEDVYSKRFGPIENEWRSNQIIQQKLPQVRAQIAHAKQTWGTLVDEHEQEIVRVMEANPSLAFDAAIAQVLVPKTKAQRDQMRADLLREINARPQAAGKTVPAAATVGSNGNSPRSIEDVIRQAAQSLK